METCGNAGLNCLIVVFVLLQFLVALSSQFFLFYSLNSSCFCYSFYIIVLFLIFSYNIHLLTTSSI